MAEASKRKGGKPEIRFKGFDEEWYFCEFKQLVDRKSDISISSMVEPSVEYDDIVSGYGILNKDVRQKEIQKFGISFDVGDILYGKLRPYLKNWLLSNFSGVAVGDFWVLVPKNCENRCFYYFIQSDSFQKVSNQSTGTKMPRSDWALVSKATFALPLSCDEQKLIGEIFSNIDTLIINQQHKYDQLQNLKKAMLEKMFPRDGADVPEIRFKGFEGAWENSKFKQLVDIERGGSPRPIDDFITEDVNGLNWIKIGDAPSQGNYITKTSEKIKQEGLSKTREVHPGDLILSNSMSFGKPYIMAIDGCIHDGWLLIRDTYKNFDLKFLCVLLGTQQMVEQYRSFASGSTVNNLNKELVGNTSVYYPHISEQKVIGEYFSNLDNLIYHQQKKLEHLKHLKAALLDKMFVSEGATA